MIFILSRIGKIVFRLSLGYSIGSMVQGFLGDIFVGRRSQLKKLAEIFHSCKGDLFYPCILVIQGEAGVGKTKLIERFARSSKGIDFLWGRCGRIDPWKQLLQDLVRIRGIDHEGFRGHEILLEKILYGGSSALQDIRLKSEESLREGISDLLFSHARLRPLLIVLDDLSYAEEETLQQLRVLVRNIQLEGSPSGLGIILITRAEENTKGDLFVKELLIKGIAISMRIQPLRKEQTWRFIEGLLGGKVGQELLEDIWRLTKGNPLFVDILVRSLLEGDRIYLKETWRRGDSQWEMPSQISYLIQQRLKLLDQTRRRILLLLAAFNRPMNLQILLRFFRKQKDFIKEELLWLAERGFVESTYGFGEDRFYQLKHELLRDAVYRSISSEDRRLLHKRIAEELKEFSPEDVQEIATQAILAGDEVLIKRYAFLAAKRAVEGFAWEKAYWYLSTFSKLPSKDEGLQSSFLLVDILLKLGRPLEGLKICEEVLQQIDALETSDKLEMMLKRIEILGVCERIEQAKECLSLIKSSIPDWRDRREGLLLRFHEALIAHTESNFPRLQEIARLLMVDSIKYDNYLRYESGNLLGAAYMNQGKLKDAEGLYTKLINEILSSPTQSQILSKLYINLARTKMLLGEMKEAEDFLKCAMELCVKSSVKSAIMLCKLNLVLIYLMQDRYEELFETLELLSRWNELMDIPQLKMGIESLFGSAYYQIGDFSRAQPRLEEALEMLHKNARLFPGDRSKLMTELALLKIKKGMLQEGSTILEEVEKELATRPVELHYLLQIGLDIVCAVLICSGKERARERFKVFLERYGSYLDLYRPFKARSLLLEGVLASPPQAGIAPIERGIQLAKQMQMPHLCAEGLCELGEILLKIHQPVQAEKVFQEGLGYLEMLLERLPLHLRHSLRGCELFQRIQHGLWILRGERIDQELLLLKKMESSFERILEKSTVRDCAEAIFKEAIVLSESRGAALFLQSELLHQSVSVDPVSGTKGKQFCIANITEGMRLPSTEVIREKISKGIPLFEKPFFYLPLVDHGRNLGGIVLELENEPLEMLKKILGMFAKRGAFVLERLAMIGPPKGPPDEGIIIPRHTELEIKFMGLGIIGHSEPMQKVYELVERLAQLEVPILLQGETGTGKELFSRAIHLLSPRREKTFLAVNCAAMPQQLLDSELFGHIRGAFTGAYADRKGLFELASGGTLFLDEIEGMSLSMQGKLLRVLEEGKIRRLGGNEFAQIDTRIITATNRDIHQMVKAGDFREDLFYRLNVAPVVLPPLRDRKEDIPLLVIHFCRRLSRERGAFLEVEPSALERLCLYSWPGNVRELENLLTRFAITGRKLLREEELSLEGALSKRGFEELYGRKLKDVEKELLKLTLEKEKGNISKTCKLLGISRATFYRMLKRSK
jgi:transcriptional regulator with AAA-type ATPase domain/tetratricopeptide (TPR) repeat protein